jgi:hypothetical protein
VVLNLALIAKRYDIGFCLDAEEADRLVISLEILNRLAHAPELAGWNGLGLAVQAYQKRAPKTVETVIAIAHRLSTIAAMDRIVVLEDGRIEEQGSHAELLARGGLYSRFWARQSGGFIGIEDAAE